MDRNPSRASTKKADQILLAANLPNEARLKKGFPVISAIVLTADHSARADTLTKPQ